MSSVSVIIASRNRPTLLSQAVASVLDQLKPEDELIIVDDGDTPSLEALAGNWRHRDRRVVVQFSGGHVGPGAARNLGVAAAVGDDVAVLDADDLCASDRLQRQRTI